MGKLAEEEQEEEEKEEGPSPGNCGRSRLFASRCVHENQEAVALWANGSSADPSVGFFFRRAGSAEEYNSIDVVRIVGRVGSANSGL